MSSFAILNLFMVLLNTVTAYRQLKLRIFTAFEIDPLEFLNYS